MPLKTWIKAVSLLVGLLGCGGSSKKKETPPPVNETPCVAENLPVNACLNQQKAALVGAKDLDQLAAQMAALTVACQPTAQEFKEFMCHFHQENR